LTNEHHLGALVITHYNRLLEMLHPDVVHILVKGRIVESGGAELADVLERDGYAAFSAVDEPDEPTSTSALDDLFAR
jgi:Fe-S cluster assembly ATP-binding protein